MGGNYWAIFRGAQMKELNIKDATFIEVPRQRNKREENAQIKAGEMPEGWDANTDKAKHKLAQKDVDARWTKKNKESHFGYKNHVNVDAENKLVQSYAVTDAAVHDSQVFEELLDHAIDERGDKREVFADSAYRSQGKEELLIKANICSQIHEKGVRGTPLTEGQKESNKIKSKTRARVEHVFGSQAQMGGHIVRTIGKLRAAIKIGLMNLVYNMRRLVQLIQRDARASAYLLGEVNGIATPAVW
jgi:IS5 family transposase